METFNQPRQRRDERVRMKKGTYKIKTVNASRVEKLHDLEGVEVATIAYPWRVAEIEAPKLPPCDELVVNGERFVKILTTRREEGR